MTKFIHYYAILLLVVLGLFISDAHANDLTEHVLGSWKGELSVGQQDIPLVFHINKDDTGSLRATMDSPAQGATDIPVSSAALNGAELTLEVSLAQASFKGELDTNTGQITGHWVQAGNQFPLVLAKSINAGRVKRPQEPTEPLNYVAQTVTFENAEAGIWLAGTLTLPKENPTGTAVVLVSGSGPQDRDQTFMGHKTFLVLADYLSSRGIAVLRFDDRGVGGSEGNFYAATSLDFAQDVNAAIDYLQNKSELAITSVGVIGHSEGGLIAPIVATQRDDVDFIIMLAGPGLSGRDIAESQVQRILKLNGLPNHVAQAGASMTRALNNTVIAITDRATLPAQLQTAYSAAWAQLSPESQAGLKAIGGGTLSEARLNELMMPWTRVFLMHEPKEYLSQIDVPIVALHGSKDTQMNAQMNLAAITAALRPHIRDASLIQEVQGVNHLFQTANSGMMSEYASIDETIAPQVLELLSNWILQN